MDSNHILGKYPFRILLYRARRESIHSGEGVSLFQCGSDFFVALKAGVNSSIEKSLSLFSLFV